MITPFHLHNKAVLITGASSGIGQQAAIACSNMGASVIVTGRHEANLNQTLKLLSGSSHKAIVCDLLKTEDIERLVSDIPGIDGFVNCAGVFNPFPLGFLSKEKINETILPNFYAAVELSNLLLRKKKLNKFCSLVFLSSISSQHPHKGSSIYSASKAAIEAFSKTIAVEYAHQMIRSNCIAPALIQTNMLDEAFKNLPEEQYQKEKEKYPFGIGQTEDVANLIVFLLSQGSKWITGQTIKMDGGLLLHY
jgi:NAD(P)-dependent dehydrogenase (short-subunit alcohol dehydrogenase family)